MRFRNAVSIATDNFGSVFKFLLYRLVTGVIFFSLIYVILKLSLKSIISSPELAALEDLIVDFFRSIASGDSERLHTFQKEFQDAVVDFGQLLSRSGGAIAGAVVGVCLMYILQRIVDGLALFAIGTMLNDRMAALTRTPFYAAYFKSVAQGVLYELIYVPLAFLFDVLSALLLWLFFYHVPSFLPFSGFVKIMLSLSLIMMGVACLQALKMTLISAWMPAMITDKKSVFGAFRLSLGQKKGFGSRFVSYLVAVYLIIAVNFAFGIFTFGSALLLTVPLSFLFLLSLHFVHYYEDTGRKYFVSAKTIAGDDLPHGIDGGDNVS